MELFHLIGQQMIPVLVPTVIAFLKTKVMPSLPAWTIPILAGVLGPAIDFALAFLASKTADPKLGLLYGLAGVGIREVYDQGKKALAA